MTEMVSEIPEWAASAAQTAVNAKDFDTLRRTKDGYDIVVTSVARALVAAERRGIERAAEIAQRDNGMEGGGYNPDFGPNVARRITYAIRQLGDTP